MNHFSGASKRLELLASNTNINVYRDFAHAPSKVKATVEAVKKQYPERKLFGILELHTYSSLNTAFMEQYKGAFDQLDVGVVFYSKHALELKRMPDLPVEKVIEGFDKNGLIVINDSIKLSEWLSEQDFSNSNICLMSSGNYDGLDIFSFAKAITQS
jgi:UDP-N-acetylmuramate: L-alanyl-gamma-D-glutamyl-meso-diaminopimelate ligase